MNIAQMVINEHGAIFAEVIELLEQTLRELGFSVRVSTNEFFKGSLNILVGHTAFQKAEVTEAIRKAGVPYIVMQLEALDGEVGFLKRFPSYVDVLNGAMQIWDYSEGNLGYLKAAGIGGGRYIPIGYAQKLERVVPGEKRDIDVLFYGMVNERRQRVIQGLRARGIQVRLFVGYGAARDELIGRSKIVLNMHQFELGRLEQVRISYLLNNRCFVISEAADENPYGEGVVYSDYKGLVETCAKYLQPGMEGERARIGCLGYEELRGVPTTARIKGALEMVSDLVWPT